MGTDCQGWQWGTAGGSATQDFIGQFNGQSFTTENTRVGCEQMQMKLRDGPFSQLDGVWRFQALGEAACKVSLALDYGFANALLEKAVGPVFGMIASTMIERFVARADAMYGQSR